MLTPRGRRTLLLRLARSVVTRVFILVTPPVLNTSTWAVSVNPN
jgi:hypothetical protein